MNDFATGFHKRKVKRRKLAALQNQEREKARHRAERARRALARKQVSPSLPQRHSVERMPTHASSLVPLFWPVHGGAGGAAGAIRGGEAAEARGADPQRRSDPAARRCGKLEREGGTFGARSVCVRACVCVCVCVCVSE